MDELLFPVSPVRFRSFWLTFGGTRHRDEDLAQYGVDINACPNFVYRTAAVRRRVDQGKILDPVMRPADGCPTVGRMLARSGLNRYISRRVGGV